MQLDVTESRAQRDRVDEVVREKDDVIHQLEVCWQYIMYRPVGSNFQLVWRALCNEVREACLLGGMPPGKYSI